MPQSNPQVLRPGLKKIIEAVEDQYEVQLDHGYIFRLVQEIRVLWQQGEGFPIADAKDLVVARMYREKSKGCYLDLYREVLDQYFLP